MARRGNSKARAQAEIAALRLQEAEIDINNRIADSVIYLIQAEAEITNWILMNLHKATIERFAGQKSPQEIRAIVDVVVNRELLWRLSAGAPQRVTPKIATTYRRSGMLLPKCSIGGHHG